MADVKVWIHGEHDMMSEADNEPRNDPDDGNTGEYVDLADYRALEAKVGMYREIATELLGCVETADLRSEYADRLEALNETHATHGSPASYRSEISLNGGATWMSESQAANAVIAKTRAHSDDDLGHDDCSACERARGKLTQ